MKSGSKPGRPVALSALRGWKLEEAKARFSEVVRLARHGTPQRVTLYGEDAVVVLAAADYNRLMATAQQPNLYELLSQSPLRDLDLAEDGVRSPVRDVEL